jgi:DNA polymerase I-like protein with 3'-5' exonuclease and polymerase domains
MTAKLTWTPDGPPQSTLTGPSSPATVVHWVRERWRVQHGEPTDDEVIKQGRFCAVRRSDDRNTRWLHEHWLEPNRDNPNAWFLALLFRVAVNDGRVAAEISLPLPWDAQQYLTEMSERKALGKPTEHYGHHAYTLYAPKGHSFKPAGHVAEILNPAWTGCEHYRPKPNDSCASFYRRLLGLSGVGDFGAGQIVADVKFLPPLSAAPDVMDFAVYGPGSRRGLARINNKSLNYYDGQPDLWTRDFRKLREQVAPEIEQIIGEPLSASDFQSCLCETDKLERFRVDHKPIQRYEPFNEAAPKKARTRRTKAVPPPAPVTVTEPVAPVLTSDWIAPTQLPDLRNVEFVAVDTETRDERMQEDKGSGWPFAAGHVCGLSVAYRIGGETHAHYFPLRHPDSTNFDPQLAYHWLHDHITAGVHFVTQNGVYDWGWLRAEADIKMPAGECVEEIGALATIVDENRYSYSLGNLCAWRGLPGKDETLLHNAALALGMRKTEKPQAYISQMPARYVGAYAEHDARSTLALFENLSPVLDQEGTRDAYRLECELLPMVLEMRRRGIRVNIAAAEQARDLLLGRRDAILKEISDQHGAAVSMKELSSSKWLASTFDHYNIKYPRTEKGNPSFRAGKTGWMKKHPHWLPQLKIKADKLDFFGATILQGFIIEHVVNNRIHAEIHPHRSDDGGSRSLRFSYSDPPLQLTPKHDEELAPLIRGVYLPEEGETWATVDVSQQEFRFIVHEAARRDLYGAAQAVERYRSDRNTDFHAFVAELTGLARPEAKNTNFAKSYGAGVRRLAEMTNKSESEAQEIIDKYDRALPFVNQLSRTCQREATRNGFVVLYDGARRHFNTWRASAAWGKGAGPCSREEAERRIKDPDHPWYRRWPLQRADTQKAMNALIQGSAARHTKLWMRACWREGVVPLLQMHDALELSVATPEQAERIAQLGCDAVSLDVPMLVDVKYGRTWGDATHSWAEHTNPSDSPPPDNPPPSPPPTGKKKRSPENGLVTAAVACAAKGWPVAPLKPDKSSHKSAEFNNGVRWGATLEADEIRRDWQRWPDAGIGIAGGASSGVWVIEADTLEAHGVDGLASLAALEAVHGALPATLIAESPRGSPHRWFKHPGNGIKVKCSPIAPGVDVIGDGGLIMVPPTERPGVGTYQWANDLPIADAPTWLIDLVKEQPHSSNGAEPEAPIERITAWLDMIPNDDEPWERFNRIGMATWRASGGSDAGLDAFMTWSAKSTKHNAEAVAERWRNYFRSPPTQIGAGSLDHIALHSWDDPAAQAHAQAQAQAAAAQPQSNSRGRAAAKQ